MKLVILAGGLGTRLVEETSTRPKPMVEIGGRPVIWHIMKMYSAHGIRDFIICLGYKGNVIKEYFVNFPLYSSDVVLHSLTGEMKVFRRPEDDWTISLIDTGELTMTGGRLRRVLPMLGDEDFCLTYGDGLSDVNISDTIAFHRKHAKQATVTGVYPPKRFGVLDLDGTRVTSFREKPQGEGGFVSGGFFVLSPKVGRLLSGDGDVWEQAPLQTLAEEGNLEAYLHPGFFHAMDTQRDRNYLEELWATGKAPWKTWK
jgi:glucose-1-phosphate cytidylyltransferase